MATTQNVEAQAWSAVLPELDFNPGAAIVRKWRDLRTQGRPVGVPVTPEMSIEDGHVAQGFSSGYILIWTGGDQVEVR